MLRDPAGKMGISLFQALVYRTIRMFGAILLLLDRLGVLRSGQIPFDFLSDPQRFLLFNYFQERRGVSRRGAQRLSESRTTALAF